MTYDLESLSLFTGDSHVQEFTSSKLNKWDF